MLHNLNAELAPCGDYNVSDTMHSLFILVLRYVGKGQKTTNYNIIYIIVWIRSDTDAMSVISTFSCNYVRSYCGEIYHWAKYTSMQCR